MTAKNSATHLCRFLSVYSVWSQFHDDLQQLLPPAAILFLGHASDQAHSCSAMDNCVSIVSLGFLSTEAPDLKGRPFHRLKGDWFLNVSYLVIRDPLFLLRLRRDILEVVSFFKESRLPSPDAFWLFQPSPSTPRSVLVAVQPLAATCFARRST